VPAKQFYYTVDDRLHPSKELAMIDYTKNKGRMLFHTGYDFTTKPWTQEPRETIADLKRRRAQQIRDKYNKVCITYSGGTDSHTVLRAFVENGIHVDEIIINRTYHNPYRVWEFEQVTLPKLQEYQKRWNTNIPVTQIRSALMDNYNDVLGGWKDKEYNSFFREVVRHKFNPIIDHFLNKHDGYGLSRYSSNDCVVFGYEKPYVHIQNGWWVWQVTDSMWGNQDNFNQHCASEAFFISDDLPEIQIKLAWEVAKFLDVTLTESQKSNPATLLKMCRYNGSINPDVAKMFASNGFSVDPDSVMAGGLYQDILRVMEFSAVAPILEHPMAKPELLQAKTNFLSKLKSEKQDKRLYNETMEYIESVRAQIGNEFKNSNDLELAGIWSKPCIMMRAKKHD